MKDSFAGFGLPVRLDASNSNVTVMFLQIELIDSSLVPSWSKGGFCTSIDDPRRSKTMPGDVEYVRHVPELAWPSLIPRGTRLA